MSDRTADAREHRADERTTRPDRRGCGAATAAPPDAGSGPDPPTPDEWVQSVYEALAPTLRRAEDGVRIEQAHSVLTGLGFDGRETVRGIARLVGAGYLDREGGRLSPGEAAPD